MTSVKILHKDFSVVGFEDINLHCFTFTYSALIKQLFCLLAVTLYFNEEMLWFSIEITFEPSILFVLR